MIEDLIPISPVLEIGRGDRRFWIAFGRIGLPDEQSPGRFDKRQRSDQESIDKAKDSGVGANTQGQGYD